MKKDVIIYGIGKIQKDFEYIFNYICVRGYLVDYNNQKLKNWNGKPIFDIEDIERIKKYEIIICDFDKEVKRNRLEQQGLEYHRHFIIADDLFCELDTPLEKITQSGEIYVWGTGKCASIFLEKSMYREKVLGCIDNDEDKEGSEFYGKRVWHPSRIDKNRWSDLFVIIAVDAYHDIKRQLGQYGLEEQKNFIWARYLMPSELLKTTMYDCAQYNLVCNTMFNTYEIESSGEVSCCCTTFVNERIGNLVYQNFNEIWYSNFHKILCLSVANKTYSFCKKDMCPVLMEKKKYEYKNDFKETAPYRRIKDTPSVILISIDPTCNLFCESCRNCVKVLQNAELEKAELMADKLLSDDNLNNAELIVMAGNGEVFLSKIYERLWSNDKTKKVKRFRLLSNGTMFTKEKWAKFVDGRTSEVVVTFSIDAATKETYKVLRRGGNYNQLMKNLEFASELRKMGKLGYFQISFVVQRKNYMEMPLFVELGKRLGVDKVFFTRILNWGTYDKEEFGKIAMTDDDGHANAELQEILNMPIMHDAIVDLGTINSKSNEIEYDYIYNYYLWEIERYLKREPGEGNNIFSSQRERISEREG